MQASLRVAAAELQTAKPVASTQCIYSATLRALGCATGLAVVVYLLYSYQNGWRFQPAASVSSMLEGFNATWLVAAAALLMFPQAWPRGSSLKHATAAGSEEAIDAGDGNQRGQSDSPFASHQLPASQDGTQGGRRPGLFRRFAKRLAMGRRMPAPTANALELEVPFRRRNSFGGRPRPSTEAPVSSRSSGDVAMNGQPLYRLLSPRRQLNLGRWQPTMTRITSQQHLADVDAQSSSTAMTSEASSLKKTPPALDLVPHSGHLAVDCLMSDATDASMKSVRKAILDDHILQFGALLGESSAELALSQRGAPGAIGPEPSCLLGAVDNPAQHEQGWEQVAEEHKAGVHYWAWRRYLRRGLYMYKSRAVYERATPDQVVKFTVDWRHRKSWDESVGDLTPLPGPGASNFVRMEDLDARTYGQSAYMYARTKFPPPMASREYLYARRVWNKTDDGGCYVISKSCTHPTPPAAGCRVVRVEDYASGSVIRATPGIYDPQPAVEVVTVYFEDSRVNAGIANLGVRKGLWPMIQKSEENFRVFVNTHLSAAPARRILEHVADPQDDPADGSGEEDAEVAPAPEDGSSASAGTMAEAPGSGRDAHLRCYYNTLTYPLSRRWRLTPVMYAGYMAAWKQGANMGRTVMDFLIAAGKATLQLNSALQGCILQGYKAVRRFSLRQLVRHMLLKLAAAAETAAAWSDDSSNYPGSAGNARSNNSKGRVSSYPLDDKSHLGLARPFTGAGRARRWGKKWAGKLAGVAVRAVGLPLIHKVLNKGSLINSGLPPRPTQARVQPQQPPQQQPLQRHQQEQQPQQQQSGGPRPRSLMRSALADRVVVDGVSLMLGANDPSRALEQLHRRQDRRRLP